MPVSYKPQPVHSGDSSWREVTMYGIGVEDSPGEFGMFFGPSPNLKDVLDFEPDLGGAVIIRFNPDKTDEVIWRWKNGEWVSVSSIQPGASPAAPGSIWDDNPPDLFSKSTPHEPDAEPHVCDYRILIDQREQAPFRFTGLRQRESEGGGRVIVETDTTHLVTGDYTLSGFEDRIGIERKSKADLYGTLGRGRRRFERELSRLQTMAAGVGFAAVVVETDWMGLLNVPPAFSRISPASIEGTILAFMQDFPGVQWVLASDRRHAEWCTWRLLDRFWRKNTGK